MSADEDAKKVLKAELENHKIPAADADLEKAFRRLDAQAAPASAAPQKPEGAGDPRSRPMDEDADDRVSGKSN